MDAEFKALEKAVKSLANSIEEAIRTLPLLLNKNIPLLLVNLTEIKKIITQNKSNTEVKYKEINEIIFKARSENDQIEENESMKE